MPPPVEPPSHSVVAPLWTCLGCRKQFSLDLSKATELSPHLANSKIHGKKPLSAPKQGLIAGFSMSGVGASNTAPGAPHFTHSGTSGLVPTGTIQLPLTLHDHYQVQVHSTSGGGRQTSSSISRSGIRHSITPYSWYDKDDEGEQADGGFVQGSTGANETEVAAMTAPAPLGPIVAAHTDEEIVIVGDDLGEEDISSTVIMLDNTPVEGHIVPPPPSPPPVPSSVTPNAGALITGGLSRVGSADPTKLARSIKAAGKNLMDRLIQVDKDTDYPLCPRCWQQSLEKTKKTVDILNQEVGAMRTFLAAPTNALSVCAQFDADVDDTSRRRMSSPTPPTGVVAVELAQVQRELDEAEVEEQELLRELAACEAELALETLEHDAIHRQHEELIQEEDQVAGRLNDVLASEWLWHHEQESQSSKVGIIEDEITRLCRFHSLSHLYEIRLDRPIPTIKNLRLGKLSTVQVPTIEINSACGIALHLLQVLAHRHRYDFPRTKLHCRGVESTLEVRAGVPSASGSTGSRKTQGKVSILDFYLKNKFFSWSTFGAGCVAFATCVNDLMCYLEGVLQRVVKQVEDEQVAAGGAGDGTSSVAAITTPPSSPLSSVRMNAATKSWGTLGFQKLQKLATAGPPRAKSAAEDKLPLVSGFSVQHGVAGDETWTKGMRGCFERLQWCVQVDGALKEPPMDEEEVYQ